MKKLPKNIRFMLLLAIATPALHHYIQANNEIQESADIAFDQASQDQDTVQLPLHAIILDQTIPTEDKLQKMHDALHQDDSANINMQDADGKTVLNLATFYNAEPVIIQFLIDNGADVNKPDRFNETPLHNAIRKEQIEVARMLLAAGANPDLQNDQLETPISLARTPETKALLGFEQGA